VAGGANVRVGISMMVDVKAIVAVSETVGVYVIIGTTVFAGVSVAMLVCLAGELEAIKDEAAAPTDETSWATINTEAMSAAAMPREAKDLLA
jgi:hypothetical protein